MPRKQFLIEFDDDNNPGMAVLAGAVYDIIQHLQGVRLVETRILIPNDNKGKQP